jgi:uncharacterized protein affecting Mg2+/Co2+ transport
VAGSAGAAAGSHRGDEAEAEEEAESAEEEEEEVEERDNREEGGSDDGDSEGSDTDVATGGGPARLRQRRTRRTTAAAVREACRYTWAYRARLWMEAPTPHAAAQLVSRQWRITDASTGASEDVAGAGVIGMFPTVTPLPSRPGWLQPAREDATDGDTEQAAAFSGPLEVAGAAIGVSAFDTAATAVRAGAGQGDDIAPASSTGSAGFGSSTSSAAHGTPAVAAPSAGGVAASAAAEAAATLQQLGEATATGGLDIPFEYCSMTTLDTPAGRGSMEGAFTMAALPAAPAGPVDVRRPPLQRSGDPLVSAAIARWPLENPAFIF